MIILKLVSNFTLMFWFYVNIHISGYFPIYILWLYNVSREMLQIYVHVIWLIYRRGQRETLEVTWHELCFLFCIGNGTVQNQFSFNEESSWWSWIIWIIYFVSAVNTMYTIWLNFKCIIIAYKLCICDTTVVCNFGSKNKNRWCQYTGQHGHCLDLTAQVRCWLLITIHVC